MKTLLFAMLLAIFAASAASAECPAPLEVSELEPLTEEEQKTLAELEKIESAADAKAQAEAEAAVPIEAFGGEGECPS